MNTLNYPKPFPKLFRQLQSFNRFIVPEHLGPNWETVLDFWTWVEANQEQCEGPEMAMEDHRYIDFLTRTIDSKVCEPMILDGLISILFFIDGDSTKHNILRATYELIAMHLIFEEGKELFFIPRLMESVNSCQE